VRRARTRNSSRTYLHRFLARAARAVPPGALVLDAGAGRGRYRHLFAHARYETADFVAVKGKAYEAPDYVCDLARIPVDDARFEHVVCTQVLEHLPEPGAVLRELGRVLVPGGRLWLTAPLTYAEHERPYDFFRYTRYGLRRLLEDAGFEVVELEPLEGYFGTLSYAVRHMSKHLPATAAAYGGGPAGHGMALAARAARAGGGPVATGLARLDLRFKLTGTSLTKNFQAVARKPPA
jgi:SAM-dependent methyltransferase